MPTGGENAENAAAFWIARLRTAEIADASWEEAVEELTQLDSNVVPNLIEALADGTLSVNVGIGNVLKRMESAVLYDLIGTHENPGVRSRAAKLLYGLAIREDAAVTDAIPALINALKDPDVDVRQWAAVALEWIGEDAKEAVPGLIEILKDEDGYVREWAAKALARMGPAAEEAMPALTEALIDDEPGVRESASEAIDTIQRGSEDS